MTAPKRNPAFSNVLYVTAAQNDAWFIPAAVLIKDNTSSSNKGSGGSTMLLPLLFWKQTRSIWVLTLAV